MKTREKIELRIIWNENDNYQKLVAKLLGHPISSVRFLLFNIE